MVLASSKAASLHDPAESGSLTGAPGSASIPYRNDIDGVRAIAVVLVVLYHAGVPGFSGGYVGVDVFFVLSGYLITGVLVAQGESDRFSLVGFYAGRFRRLLPLSILTLVTTVAFGVWLLPTTRATELIGDSRSALLYVSNWRFADKAVAYGETEVSEGMLTHFWSLSVEEQFYFVWPLLIGAAIVSVRRFPRVSLRSAVFVLAAIVTLVSLWMSVKLTPSVGSRAYYLTHLRLWEIAAGALLAVLPLAAARCRLPLRAVVQVASVVAIFVVADRYDDLTPFPGSAALVPVLAAMGLILMGGGGGPVDRVLASTPMQYVGHRSYAWYLWHWPALGIADLLVLRYGWAWSRGAVVGSAVAVSLVLAIVSHRLLEGPIRFSPALRRLTRATVVVGVLGTVVLVVATFALHRMVVGASAKVWADAVMTPEEAVEDTASQQFRKCHNGMGQGEADRLVAWCEAGDPDGEVTVALIGDSHAQHWAPAFDAAGVANGWRIIVTTRSACLPYDVPIFNGRLEILDEGCRAWGRAVEDAIAAEGAADLVAVGRARAYAEVVRSEDGGVLSEPEVDQALTAAVDEFLGSVLETSDAVMIMSDTPWAPHRVPECLLRNSPRTTSECNFEAKVLPDERPLLEAEGAAAGLHRGATLSSSLFSIACPTEVCDAVTPDGIITYRDGSHLSATYSRSLGDDVAEVISGLIDE